MSPLIENLPIYRTHFVSGNVIAIYDLLIACGIEYVNTSSGNYVLFYYLYVRDQQPVMIGASYHYFVMRMNEKHEISETIDAGIVTIPPN